MAIGQRKIGQDNANSSLGQPLQPGAQTFNLFDGKQAIAGFGEHQLYEPRITWIVLDQQHWGAVDFRR
jgi:hypothetical protein